MTFSYYIDHSLPFPHVVYIWIKDPDADTAFPQTCRETFESMGRQFMMTHEYVWDESLSSGKNIVTKHILYLESEDMAMWLRLTYG